jgi:hypothetical protein
MNNPRLQADREKERRTDDRLNDNVASSDRRSLRALPWAWIALSGAATFVWVVGIGWVTVKLFQWLTD